MICPRCGRETSVSTSSCPSCRSALGLAVASSVLTPPPTDVPVADSRAGDADLDGDTSLGGLAPAPDDAETRALNIVQGAEDEPTSILGPRSTITRPRPPAAPIDEALTLLPTASSTPIPDSAQTILPRFADDLTRPPVATTASTVGASETGPLTPGENFGTRYHIIRMLGLGGMGAVYQAWDAELGVAVAIKVIRPDAMADRQAAIEVERRFKRELLLARQVTHKNVVRIHDIGEIDGIKYITMSYVDGIDLATLLRQKGALPVRAVVRLSRSIVAGLVAAHAAGVVHRDLKPANIMIGSDGEALIMDFGIARSTGGPAPVAAAPGDLHAQLRRTSPRALDATMNGLIVGTVQYMAPEQAKGEAVDQRADIYAFGLILYDLLVGGRRMGQAESALAELDMRMASAPPGPRTIVPQVPQALNALVLRCLDPDPAKRFQTTTAVAVELTRLDENGEPLPVKRVVGLPLMAGVVVLLLGLSGGVWWYTRNSLPPPAHDPVSVVIADFTNATNDPAFDRTLEPMMKLALEGAGFISAYDRSGITRNLGVRPPDTLDQQAAQQIAIKQGIGVVLSGSLERVGSAYRISLRAMQAVAGTEISRSQATASSKDQVLAVATDLAGDVRQALGDDTSDSAQRFAMETLTATSLDVVHDYAMAMDALSNSKPSDARDNFAKAVARDPNFGLAYAGLAIASRNIGEQQAAERYVREAIRHLDTMTERERYRTRGLFYYLTRDYSACVKEYGDLIARYAADAAARNNLALCETYLRNMPKAIEDMRRVVEILPNRALYHDNLALYAAYGGDFMTAEREAQRAQELGSPRISFVARAFSQIGQGQLAEAAQTYAALAKVDALGASYGASGLGDLALYEGRFAEAVRILEAGSAADLMSKDSDRAAAKLTALAYARVNQRQSRAAIAAAEKAVDTSGAVKIRFLAARAFVAAGAVARARTLATSLASELQAEPQAYAKIIEGEAALQTRDTAAAIKLFTEANTLLDTWIGRFALGRAYLEAGAFVQADSEFDRCIKRRGEALSLFLDEEPTSAFLPPVYYFQGRVREGLKTAAFADSYRTYLAIRGAAGEDPLLADVRTRIAR